MAQGGYVGEEQEVRKTECADVARVCRMYYPGMGVPNTWYDRWGKETMSWPGIDAHMPKTKLTLQWGQSMIS